MTRVVLDGVDVRAGGRGVTRVLRQVLPLLAGERGDLEGVIVTTEEGSRMLGGPDEHVVVVPDMPSMAWEQGGLPWYARKLGAAAIYSHSECGPLAGPPTLLHVPEDPHVRWRGAPADTAREKVRRAYQRVTMPAGLRRARIVATSCNSVANALVERFSPGCPQPEIVPLGVDAGVFHPGGADPAEAMIFHLGSSEPRDESLTVLRAYAHALGLAPDLPDLAIAGNLGHRAALVRQAATLAGIRQRVHLLGRISDEELRRRYASAAMCVQPAHYEGFGLQPLEALACGAPLIVSADPAVEEVVGDAAVVVPGADPELLAQAMADLWRDGAKQASLREAGPRRAAGFSWAATAEKIHTLLEAVIQDAA